MDTFDRGYLLARSSVKKGGQLPGRGDVPIRFPGNRRAATADSRDIALAEPLLSYYRDLCPPDLKEIPMQRTVVLAAALVSALTLGRPQLAAAQDPDPAPPPAPKQGAVPRSERMAPREGEGRPAEGRSRREPPSAPPERRVEAAPATAAPTASPDDGQRRGAVRRPPSGGTSRGDSPRGETGTVDRAVPRSSAPRPASRVYVFPDYYRNSYYRYYDPWGFGAFGLGYFYYSPWAWGPGYYAYGAPYGYYGGPGYSAYGFDTGSVKLKVKPRDAEVFVDGYYAGVVDDFDGVLQSLKLDAGAHAIEIRKAGLETLRFDVRVEPERSITFRGEMKAMP
jgi:hypothetical protein